MKVDIDFSGLEKFLAEAENEIKQGMIEAAHEGVDFARTHGEYKNHTHNLRSAPGAAVVMDGEIVDMYIPAESGHQKAKEKTENLLLYGKRPKNGIILADGMEYASFVESKGYDVLSGGALHTEAEAQKKFRILTQTLHGLAN